MSVNVTDQMVKCIFYRDHEKQFHTYQSHTFFIGKTSGLSVEIYYLYSVLGKDEYIRCYYSINEVVKLNRTESIDMLLSN